MPVRKVGKTPLPLLRNAQVLGRKYSLGFYGGPDYPAVEKRGGRGTGSTAIPS